VLLLLGLAVAVVVGGLLLGSIHVHPARQGLRGCRDRGHSRWTCGGFPGDVAVAAARFHRVSLNGSPTTRTSSSCWGHCSRGRRQRLSPIAWTREELHFAIGAPVVLGALALIGGVFRHNGCCSRLASAAWRSVRRPLRASGSPERSGSGRWRRPPPLTTRSPSPTRRPPAPEGWLRLGTGFGLPALWMAVCVLVLPIVVYVGLYVPWAMPWQPETPAATTAYQNSLPVLFCPDADQNGYCVNGDGWPNGHTGKTLIEQTIEMYNYHNNLREGHPASSPCGPGRWTSSRSGSRTRPTPATRAP